MTPESHAGLFYIALGLFHPDKAVRDGVVILLERIRESEAGRHFWAGLGRFAKLAFFRLRRESEGPGPEQFGGGANNGGPRGIDGRIKAGMGRSS